MAETEPRRTPGGTASGRLKGRVALITGAGSVATGIGNGRATAIVYAREGARIALVDANERAAEDTRRMLAQEGGESFAVKADVSNAPDCRRAVEQCVTRYGRIDILHNNVGIEVPGGLEDTTEQSWDATMAVNLKSMFLMSKYAIQYMVKQKSGAIVNISSINAIRTLPALSLSYGVSKAGVIALTREVAVQYAPCGIRVNAILPGMMATPFVVASLTGAYGGEVDEMMKKRDALCPMGRQGDAWDVAYLALFLASDEAKYITGAAVVVDGAQTCKIFGSASEC
jgi:NAD(P)-dependent dehydrogenase (short-subunit alcohol dehydrogenase family)